MFENVNEMAILILQLAKFPSLTLLGMNFTYISAPLLKTLTTPPSSVKKRLVLSLDSSETLRVSHMMTNRDLLTSNEWKEATKRCVERLLKSRFTLISLGKKNVGMIL